MGLDATVSIIVPAYNAADCIEACAAACLAQTRAPLEVIVVDDGSQDGTAEAAARTGARVITQANAGPAAARNRGAREARGEVLVFTDSDCVPEADWVKRLCDAWPVDAAAAGGTYSLGNPDAWLAQVVHAEIEARHARMGQPGSPAPVDFLGSFNVAILRGAFEAVGGFDESFRQASGEDNDLSYRLIAAGYKLAFIADAPVAHRHPERVWPYLRTQARHGFWRMKLYAKHPNRSGGDRYAGLSDLAGPPFTLAWPAVLALELGLFGSSLVSLVCLAGYVAMKYRAAWRIRGYLPEKRGWMIPDLLAARDIARGLGLAWGVWHFVLMRRTSI